MRQYRAEIALLLFTIVLCALAVRAFSEDPPKAPAVALKPGDEVKPLELESAKLGKLKAQLARDEAQETILQQQFSSLENDRRELQGKIDALVKEIQARVKKEKNLEIIYDQRVGEDGTFRVAPTVPPPSEPAKKPS